VILAILLSMANVGTSPASRGACLDSAKVVPMNMLSDNSALSDVVRIDSLRWDNRGQTEIIGFVYRLQRGDSWFGTRRPVNMTPAATDELGRWLRLVVAKPAALRMQPIEAPGSSVAQYQLRDDWRRTLSGQHLSTAICVAWPKNETLPPQPK
jgi:hypothetical protein